MTMIETIIAAAKLASVPPALLLSICSAESDLRSRVNVQDGDSASYGVCQLKLATARMIDPMAGPSLLLDPEYNAMIAAYYVAYQMQRYPGDEDCVIAAYNAGTCRRHPDGRILNRKYVKRVRDRMKGFENGTRLKKISN
jgi:soluble lytic murein transglycosylase-like protein